MGKHTTIILSAAANQGKWIVSMNLLKRFMWNCFHASQEIGQIMKCVSCESVSMMSQIKSAMMASLPCKNTQWRNKTKQWVWIVALGFFVMQLFNGLDQCERENTDDTKKKTKNIRWKLHFVRVTIKKMHLMYIFCKWIANCALAPLIRSFFIPRFSCLGKHFLNSFAVA